MLIDCDTYDCPRVLIYILEEIQMTSAASPALESIPIEYGRGRDKRSA
jgi:hypothetical protein